MKWCPENTTWMVYVCPLERTETWQKLIYVCPLEKTEMWQKLLYVCPLQRTETTVCVPWGGQKHGRNSSGLSTTDEDRCLFLWPRGRAIPKQMCETLSTAGFKWNIDDIKKVEMLEGNRKHNQNGSEPTTFAF